MPVRRSASATTTSCVTPVPPSSVAVTRTVCKPPSSRTDDGARLSSIPVAGLSSSLVVTRSVCAATPLW